MGRIEKLERVVEHLWELEKKINTLIINLKDIKDNELGLDFINDIRTVTFKKKAPSEYPEEFEQYNPSKTERKNPDRINYGFIAQEVKEVIDNHGLKDGFDMWQEDETDGRQRIGEASLMPLMVKAIQELSAKVEELETKLNNKE